MKQSLTAYCTVLLIWRNLPQPKDIEVSIEPSEGARPLSRRANLPEEQVAEYRDAFDIFAGTKAFVNRKELKHILRSVGVDVRKETLARLQIGRTGPMDFDEFLALMTQIINEKDIQEEMMKAFSLFDINSTGKITFENLKRVSEQLGEIISDDELQRMIREADLDNDGAVDASEFVRVMKKTELW